MAKLELNNISNISGAESTAIATINNNSAAIETALENTLSRNGASPNTMSADIDLNGNDLLNAGTLETNELILGGQVVATGELGALPDSVMLKPTYDPASRGSNVFNGHPVADRTTMKALDVTDFDFVYLKETGREGSFVLREGTPPYTDTYEGFYVASDTAGFYWERQLGAYYALAIEWFGATPDVDTFDNHDIIEKAFALSDLLGIKAVAGAGTFWIQNTVFFNVTKKFEFQASPGTIFKTTADFPVDNKIFFNSGVDQGGYSFKWYGGKIDGSLRGANTSGAPDSLSINGTGFDEVVVQGVWFYNNDDFRTGIAGDAALFIDGHENIDVSKCLFQGTLDTGFYLSGDNTESFGRRCRVTDNVFLKCYGGFISKRSYEDHVISGNFVLECINGITVGGEAGTDLLPGKKATITGNYMKNVLRGIEARVSDGTVIVGNRIEDYGQDPRDGSLVGDAAIVINGSKSCVVSGNVAILSGAYAPSVSSSGVWLLDLTFNAVTYTSTHNLITGNAIHKASIGVRENAGSGANHNQIIGNSLTEIVTARVQIVGANTVYQDLDQTAKRLSTVFGSSGGLPAASTNILRENSGNLFETVLLPNTASWVLFMGDPNNNAVARMQYDHAADRWSWRAGGSGTVFQIDSAGPMFGTHAAIGAETVTGYITVKDLAGSPIKLAVVS